MASSFATAPCVSLDRVAAFLQEIIVDYESYKLQRSDPREPVSIPVESVQLDFDFEPISAPFHMVTRDISCGGAGLFHTAEITAPYIQLEFCSPVDGDRLFLVATVEQCTPCGQYFIIGCQFLTNGPSK